MVEHWGSEWMTYGLNESVSQINQNFFSSCLLHLTFPIESHNWMIFRIVKLKSYIFSFQFEMLFWLTLLFTTNAVAIKDLFAVLMQCFCKVILIIRDRLTWSNSLMLEKGMILFPLILIWSLSSTASFAPALVLFWHISDQSSSLNQQNIFFWVSSPLTHWIELTHQGVLLVVGTMKSGEWRDNKHHLELWNSPSVCFPLLHELQDVY